MSFPHALIGAVVLLTSVAAFTDVRTRRIPNWLTVSATAAAVLYYAIAHQLPGVLFSLAGFGAGFGILLTLWMIGGGGGGDVKLMGALGAMLGPKLTLLVFLVSVVLALLGSVLVGLAGIASHGLSHFRAAPVSEPPPAARPVRELDDRRLQHARRQRRLIPFALPVAMGAWLVLAWQVWVP